MLNGEDAGNIWWCPCQQIDLLRKMVAPGIAAVGYFHTGYGYFARVNSWEPGVVSNPEDLTGRELLADKLLMVDATFYWWGSSAWSYNHGLRGPSSHYPGFAGRQASPNAPSLVGMNQLYGDLHISWVSAEHRNSSTLPAPNQDYGKVSGLEPEGSYYLRSQR